VVDLGLIRLPDDALIFPNTPEPGEDFSFTAPRDPHTFTKQFMKRAKKLGFAGFWFHISGGHTRRCYSIAACRCIRSPNASAMTRPSC
jgi:hypothetical protein